uniref:SURF1-like protein n=1 Tax=Heterorhabditis bacteriophora TaxID=37862 RepID=A0A1I7XGL7_HETBA
MAIVAEHSIGRVWQEEGERNGDIFWFSNGTDPAQQIPLRMTYTTRPSQDFSDQYKSDRIIAIPTKLIKFTRYLDANSKSEDYI